MQEIGHNIGLIAQVANSLELNSCGVETASFLLVSRPL